jgi:xylulokinase
VAAGAATLDTAWASRHVRIAPDPAPRALYDELYGVYRGLYPATADALHTLAALQRGPRAAPGQAG